MKAVVWLVAAAIMFVLTYQGLNERSHFVCDAGTGHWTRDGYDGECTAGHYERGPDVGGAILIGGVGVFCLYGAGKELDALRHT